PPASRGGPIGQAAVRACRMLARRGHARRPGADAAGGSRYAGRMEWLVLTLGVVLGLGGLGLGAWGLFGDRPRGRRRCPACWYRMDGVRGRSCPECGRTARSERALLRTRRRWGWTAAGVLLVIAGAGLGGWSRWM